VACLQEFSNFFYFHLFMGSNGPGGPVAKGKQGRQKLPTGPVAKGKQGRQKLSTTTVPGTTFCFARPSQDTSHSFVLDQAPQLLMHPSQTLSSQLHSKLNQTKTETGRCCESIFCIEEMSDWIQQNVSANVGWSLILLVFIPPVAVYEASY
jgi:hypothetical protein